MIRTITESEALTLTVRGYVSGVLGGAAVPVEMSATYERDGDVTRAYPEGERWFSAVSHGMASNVTAQVSHPLGTDWWGPRQGPCAIDRLRLPLARPEVQAHLVGWLGRGLARAASCPCRGGECMEPACDWVESDWLRRPANRYAWLTPEAHGGLPDWIRLALIWGSVVRVAAGVRALTEALGPWAPDVGSLARDTWGRPLIGSCLVLRSAGYATSDADRRWLADGKALLDDAPTGRVIRLEVPE